jgi:hypothetical protein
MILCIAKTNINPDFVAACPQIITFKGPIAMKVYCPENGPGLKDWRH